MDNRYEDLCIFFEREEYKLSLIAASPETSVMKSGTDKSIFVKVSNLSERIVPALL